ncbi:MAG: hypothetical protein C6Y20_20805 [Tagaea sp. CACIAM 22H2]|nr:hypothetical protein [Tagaea sp. CACIAM 22H2]
MISPLKAATGLERPFLSFYMDLSTLLTRHQIRDGCHLASSFDLKLAFERFNIGSSASTEEQPEIIHIA